MNTAREEILGKVRTALKRNTDSPLLPVPTAARIASRVPDDTNAEVELLLGEVAKLGGIGRKIARPDDMVAALEDLVKTEQVRMATMWTTPDLQELGLSPTLAALGVEVISPYADKRELARCDLGITGVDIALPETGTLLLRSMPERPRLVSLLPHVHLAILRPTALRADLHQALAEVKSDNYFVCVTGPSRTADIELTLTIGVHGPKALYVWTLN